MTVRTQSKKILHALAQGAGVAALAAMVSAVLLAQQPEKTITFTDTFTPWASALWNNYDGDWTAVGGQYYARLPNYLPNTYTGLPFSLIDYTLTVNMVDGDGGIWLRSNGTGKSGPYILLVLGGDGYGQGERGGTAGTSIYFASSSDPGVNLNQVDGVLTPGDTYTITVTALGNTYSVYLNGSTTPVATLVDSTLPGGLVGLYDDQPNVPAGGFGPPTAFSNFSLTGRAVPPLISAFSPESGTVGAKVKIAGVNLLGATAVTFNGTAAKFLQRYPSTDIFAMVPDFATTGPIEVTTLIGKVTSQTSFTVTGAP